MPKDSFIKDRIKSIGFALRGAIYLIRTERSIMIQVAIAIIVTIAGFYFKISPIEWMIQLMAIGLVLGVEGLNTVFEKLSDYIQPAYDEKIGRIKDISAGAVLLVSVAAAIVGLIIYIPRIF